MDFYLATLSHAVITNRLKYFDSKQASRSEIEKMVNRKTTAAIQTLKSNRFLLFELVLSHRTRHTPHNLGLKRNGNLTGEMHGQNSPN